MTIEQQRRFLENLEKQPGKDACWLWRGNFGGKNSRPYFHLNGHHVSPRRIAWQMHGNGELGPRVYLYPVVCRDPWCVNPDHMSWQVGGGNMRRQFCGRGHDMTEPSRFVKRGGEVVSNVYITSQGKRACRQCIREQTRDRRLRYLAEGRGWGGSYRAA